MLDLPKFVEGLHEYMARALRPLSERLVSLESRQPERGEKGERGDLGPPGERGAKGEPGEKGAAGDKGDIGTSGVVGPQGERGEKGDPGEKGDSGSKGEDGKDITIGELLPAIEKIATQRIAEIPKPRDGADGKDGTDGVPGMDGKDGTSLTVEDVRPMFESELAKWALEFERRATDLIQRCIDRIEKPKDGAPGKDGRDALELENIGLALSDDERTLTFAFIRGETHIERSVELHHPIYREIYKEGAQYRRGDTVTFGGSQWSAMRDTDSKPETDDSWRLSVKRGRDGKDGAPGPRGPEGRKGKDAGHRTGPGPY